MKANKGLIIGLAAAGIAAAGVIVFLTTTKAGKKAMKSWGVNKKQFAERVEGVVKEAKKKVRDLKDELAYKNDEVVTQAYE